MSKPETCPQIIYAYDALCGWCYGFSPVITQLRDQFLDEIDFRVISGGMVLGEREGPIGEVAPYIKSAYRDVEQATGISFGKAFLEDVLDKGEAWFSSWRPALALSAWRSFNGPDALPFSTSLQKAVYELGLPPAEDHTYRHLAAQWGLDADAFLEKMKHEDTARDAQSDFALCQELQVAGFPTVFYVHGKQWMLISRGYAPASEMKSRLRKARAMFAAGV